MPADAPKTPDLRRRQTLGALAAVIVLLVLGIWVFARLDASQKAQACMESGGRRCAIIDTDALPKK